MAALDGATDRGARYVCVIVAIGPGGEEVVTRGTLEGSIALAASGDEGFGFDPVFVPEGESATVAELGDELEADALASCPRRDGARRRLPS